MKKVVSFCLAALLAISTSASAFAQKTRVFSPSAVLSSAARDEARFASATAYTDGKGVWVQWTMESERNNFGFQLYRLTKFGYEAVPGADFVGGSATHVGKQLVSGTEYNTFVPAGSYRSVFFVESVLSDGTRVKSQPFGVQLVRDLTPYAGATSSEMLARTQNSQRSIESQNLAMPRDLRKEVESYRTEADATTHRLVMSKPGAKITVKKEGLYHITKDELIAGGFDASTDPGLWQLYVEGVEQPLIVGPNGSYIEFYGIGADTSEADYRVYFMITGDSPGKRFATRVARLSGSTVVSKSYMQSASKKERILFLDTLFNGEAENFVGTTIFTTPANVTFNLTAVDFSAPTANIQLKLQGYSLTDHNWSVSLNGQALQFPVWNGRSTATNTFSVPTSFLQEGTNTLQFLSGGSTDAGFFDTVTVTYPRKFVADQNQVAFFTDNYKIARVDGFTSAAVRVFDITDKNAPILMTNLSAVQNGPAYSVDLPAARSRVFYGVENSAMLSPASIVPNNPVVVSDSAGADMIIIAYKDFLPQADAWANYRRAQGLTVNVVDVSDVYDEFNYGQLGWEPIKDFLAYAYANWTTRPKYVLLMGDGSYDPRDYFGLGKPDYIPMKLVTTVFSETASDETLADFDNDGNAEVAIGRIAAGSAESITNVYNKTVAWESSLNATSLDRGAVFAYDNPVGWDFQGTSTKLRDSLPAGVPSTLVDRAAADSGTTLLNQINAGKFVVNYSGHGTSSIWSAASFFGVGAVANLTNASSPSLFTSLTCLNGYFQNPRATSLSEAITNSPNGAVAIWASSGETTPDIQEVMAIRFYSQLGAGSIPRLGDLIKDAKLSLSGGLDVKLSWVLVGDPALKVR
jgi:hypothetical protein